MAEKWQVMEKSDIGTDWSLVRYDDSSTKIFSNKEEAIHAAKNYITKLNCDNALTRDEKRNAAEAFMLLDGKVFLGVLDNKDWYLTDHKTGKPIVDKNHYELQGKVEVDVKKIGS